MGSKSTISQMQQVAKKLVIDLRIEETKEALQKKMDQVAMVFGEDFVEEISSLMATLVGVEILGDPANPLVQTCQQQEQAILKQARTISDGQKQHTRLMSEINNLRSSLGAVRKLAKDIPDGLHKEASRLRDKSEPTRMEAIILACEERFKDILIRTKGIC